jgi:GNAT superfamily N-acetyltransferase
VHVTSDAAHLAAPTPAGFPAGWTARGPALDDLDVLVELRGADRLAHTGSAKVDREAIESEIVGQASWTRRQLLAVDPHSAVAAGLYAWGEEQAQGIATLREVTSTRLDASPFADDTLQQQWLTDAGYTKRRTWPQMTRPVTPDEATSLPKPREGVTLRRVASHENGLPIARDLQLVHEMLESSFEDHFNSYRESFPEFVQRLREDPGHRWDHWWLAFVDVDGTPVPAGAIVCSVLGPDASGAAGTYVEYIGVNRAARGRGVAKGLLNAVIADVVDRGRNRVSLEVDADSPTSADQLYLAMGWATDYVTESWFLEVDAVRLTES